MFWMVFHWFLSRLPGVPAAYIDPNTGGMLFQLLAIFLAAFSAILFFFSRQIKTFWARLRRKAHEEETVEGSGQEEQPANTKEN